MSLLSKGHRLAGAGNLNRCIYELLQLQQTNSSSAQPMGSEASTAPLSTAADAPARRQQQQQNSPEFTQLLQQLQVLHMLPLCGSSSSSWKLSGSRQGRMLQLPASLQLQRMHSRSLHSTAGHTAAAAAAAWPAVDNTAAVGTAAAASAAAEPSPAAGGAQQQQQQHAAAGLPFLRPYQQAVVDAVTSQLSNSQPRLLLQLPPSAAVNHIITHLASEYATSHSLLLLVSSSARAAALKSTLMPLLNPCLSPVLLGSQGLGPRVVPGETVKPQHRVLIADLEQLQSMPSAAVQLLELQQAPQVLAVYEDGFYNPIDLSVSASSSSSSRSDSWGVAPEQQGQTPAKAAAGARGLAQQLLRQLRFIPQKQTAQDPTRPLVYISSRDWQQLLLPSQLVESSSSASQGFALPGLKLLYPEAAAAGLLRPAATVRVPAGTRVPPTLVASVDASVLLTLRSSSSSSSSTGKGSLQQQQQQVGVDAVGQLGALLLSDKPRTRNIAAACKALSDGGKAIVYACGQHHAREVNLALNLQGVSSLALHEGQSPEDQAAVLWAFENNTDRVLVASSSCIGVLAAAGLSCQVKCVVMGVPIGHPEVYAAAAAPGLLSGFSGQAGWGADSSSSCNSNAAAAHSCLFVEFSDRLQLPDAATAALPAAAAAAAIGSKRHRRSRTVLQTAADTAAAAAAAEAGGASGSGQLSFSCLDLFGSNMCQLLPLPDTYTAFAIAATKPPLNRSSSRTTASSSSSSKGDLPSAFQPGITGDLIWTICDDSSWAIPIKRGRGRNMDSLRVLWLTKGPKGFLAQQEEGLGHMVPLPGAKKSMPLQKARLLAEEWLKAHYPLEAQMRELGLEWRDRPMSDAQVIFCERYGVVYDREWTRGTANMMIDKFVVQVLRHPIEERQLFMLRHLAPFAPQNLTSKRGTTMTYQHTAALLQEALLQGLRDISSTTAAAVAAASATASSSSSTSKGGEKGGVQNGSKGSAGTGMTGVVLAPRKTLILEQEAIWEAGLRPKYTWMVLQQGRELLLDLMSGSYLWLSKADDQQQQQEEDGADGVPDAAAAGSASSSSSSSSSAGPYSLDGQALYSLALELPDGSRHSVRTAAAALQLLQQFEQQQQQGSACAAVTGSTSSSSGSPSSSKGPLPLPLSMAMSSAEQVAAGLVSSHAAFLGRNHVVRLCSMVGGWRVPAKSSESQVCLPASDCQLKQLREAGLPVSKKYTSYDAHRELLRHQKTQRLPEPLATRSQLDRLQELQLPVTAAAAATLTYTQAKAMLYRAQLGAEPALDKQALDEERAQAKQRCRLAPGAQKQPRSKNYYYTQL